MNRPHPVLAIFCASTLIPVTASAQEAPAKHIDVRPLVAKERQDRAVVTALQDQVAALERAATLLSQDPADQAALTCISSILAVSKRQLEAAKAAYEFDHPDIPAPVLSNGHP